MEFGPSDQPAHGRREAGGRRREGGGGQSYRLWVVISLSYDLDKVGSGVVPVWDGLIKNHCGLWPQPGHSTNYEIFIERNGGEIGESGRCRNNFD